MCTCGKSSEGSPKLNANHERAAGITIGSEKLRGRSSDSAETQRTREWGCNGRMHERG